MERAIKECQLEADKCAFDTEKKRKFGVFKIVKWLKESCCEETELGDVFEKQECLEEEKETHLIDAFFTYHFFFSLKFRYSFCRNKKMLTPFDLYS